MKYLSLGSVYRFIYSKDLVGSYTSLVDTKAQTDVVLHPYLNGYWDKKYSVRTIYDIWMKKKIMQGAQMEEVNWAMPEQWQTGNNLATWTTSFQHLFEGPCVGPAIYGPSNTMPELYRVSDSNSSIFFALFLTALFNYIAVMSQKYDFQDWVASMEVVDRDSKVAKTIEVFTSYNI